MPSLGTAAVAAQSLEQRALRFSMRVSIGFAVVAIVWGLIGGSQVILLDAVYTPLSLLLTWGSVLISRVVAKGPSRLFPFGRDALIPLFVIAQAFVLFGTLGYAILEAIRVIRSGGAEVSGWSLLAYGLFSSAVCLIAWWVLRRMANGQSLVEAEAAGWLAAGGSSVVIVLGGGFVLAVQGTQLAGLAPFADSVLVMVSGVALMAVPFGLLRRSIHELQNPAPNPVVQQQVREVVEAVRQRERLPEPILRIGRMGATLTLELGFVLDPGTGDVACEDRVRRAVREGLAEVPYELWVVVEFSHDRSLVE